MKVTKEMRTKIIIAITACLFATVSIINVPLTQNHHNRDVSLADISVMAQADGESGETEYCWTDATMGGLYTITPCGDYDPNSLPPYQCGEPVSFCWAGGTKEQCY